MLSGSCNAKAFLQCEMVIPEGELINRISGFPSRQVVWVTDARNYKK
jgi:hypothetical protein